MDAGFLDGLTSRGCVGGCHRERFMVRASVAVVVRWSLGTQQ